MRSIAQRYIDEGMEKGIEKGIKKGENRVKVKIAKKLLAENASIPYVSKITGLSIAELNELLNSA